MDITPLLKEVEENLASRFNSDAPALTAVSEYLLTLGGKRLRPLLTLVTHGFITERTAQKFNAEQSCLISAGIELIHMATLLHDDIIDKSDLRRHKISPRAKFGESATLLAGDFLLSRAFGICSHFHADIVRETEKACVELTEGEVLETPLNLNKHNLDTYKTIAEKKTATLFSLASYVAAHLAGSRNEELKNWSTFGRSFGLAYQMLDDIADAVLTTSELGKPVGLDLIEKKPSLVNILWLDKGSSLAKEILLSDESCHDEKKLQIAINEIVKSGAAKEAFEIMKKTKSSAFEHLKNEDFFDYHLQFFNPQIKLEKLISQRV